MSGLDGIRARLVLALALAFCALANADALPGADVIYQPLPSRTVLPPRMACSALAQESFDRVAEGAARVLSATSVAAIAERAAFCDVHGYVAPTIEFELWLPEQGYTGRYLQGGCGGNCGRVPQQVTPACDNRVAFGGAFAVGFEDSGHVGGDGVWALGGAAVREDFAYRAAHAFALAAKRIIAVYYGSAPAFSYFQGCSDGGREAMAETQRYPDDFNGVLAGAPAFAITEAMERFIWEARWGHDDQGQPIFDSASLTLLHAAVLQACDGLDGLKDGQIDDPRACHFDPQRLVCDSGNRSGCLSAQQVMVAQKFYQGPRTRDGEALFYGGEPYGAELTWNGRIALSEAGGGMLDDAVRNMIYVGELPDSVSIANWSFDRATFDELRRRGALYDANQTDLSAFRSAGGKLILWQGAADTAAGVYGLADYYQRLRDAMGGLSKTQRFARYFLVPGVYHCGNGYVPYEMHLLGTLVQWVETASAPERVLAIARLADGSSRARPVFAYPAQATYIGRGDPNDWHNFHAVQPQTPPDDHYPWAGSAPAPQSR